MEPILTHGCPTCHGTHVVEVTEDVDDGTPYGHTETYVVLCPDCVFTWERKGWNLFFEEKEAA